MMFHVEHSCFGVGLVIEGVVNVPRGTLPLVPTVRGWTRQTGRDRYWPSGLGCLVVVR